MADKELKKMNRRELIEIIYALQQSEETLKKKNLLLQRKLDDRTLRISKAGSIADAAMALNDIFKNAQETADQYIHSVKVAQAHAKKEAEKELREAKEEAEKIRTESNKEAKKLIFEAKEVSEHIMAETEKQKKQIEEKTEWEISNKWKIFNEKVNGILSEHSAIRDLLEGRTDGER